MKINNSENNVPLVTENQNNILPINPRQIIQPPRLTMPPNTNYQLIKLYIDIIPQYNGDTHTLGIFIESAQNLLNTFFSADADLNTFLLRAIIGKLSGRALTLIGSRIELRTWDQIKDALNLCFGDQRNIECLVQDLISLSPNKNETPYNFGMRIQDQRSLIISKVNSSSLKTEEKIIYLQSYDNLALKTFIKGLTGQLQNNIRLRNPDSLEKAMSLVIEEENFSYSQNRHTNLNSQSFKNVQRLTPLRTSYQNPQITRPNFFPTFSTNFVPRPNFPNRPMIPRQNFNNTNFNNQNSFVNRTPTFNPNFAQNSGQTRITSFGQRPFFNQNRPMQPNLYQNRQIPNKPEPMDTSSGNTRINHNNIQNSGIIDHAQLLNTENYNQYCESDFNQYDLNHDYNNVQNYLEDDPSCYYNYDYQQNNNNYTFDTDLVNTHANDQISNTDCNRPDNMYDNTNGNLNFRLDQAHNKIT